MVSSQRSPETELWLLPIIHQYPLPLWLSRIYNHPQISNLNISDIADGLVGVGLITSSEDCPGVLTLDKGYNEMSKFLNRILGMHVEKQNLLFKYFSDTLSAIIQGAKRSGRYDQGILDVGTTLEDRVELARTHTFLRKHATGKAKIELHVLQVERGKEILL